MTIPTYEELYKLAYIPNQWVCPKCGFAWTKSSINAETGQMGTSETDRQSEPCPNDGEWMEPATYRDAAESSVKRFMEEFDKTERLTKAFRKIAALPEKRRASFADNVGDAFRECNEVQKIANAALEDSPSC